MCNLDIRDDLKKNGVYQWQVAHELGICEMTLARWLRFEMSEEKSIEYLKQSNGLLKILANGSKRQVKRYGYSDYPPNARYQRSNCRTKSHRSSNSGYRNLFAPPD